MHSSLEKVYKCDHCNKKSFSASGIKKHETICFRNPINKRACLNCSHLIKKRINSKDDPTVEVSAFYCDVVDKFLYHPITEHRNYKEKYPKTMESQERMADECDFQSWLRVEVNEDEFDEIVC